MLHKVQVFRRLPRLDTSAKVGSKFLNRQLRITPLRSMSQGQQEMFVKHLCPIYQHMRIGLTMDLTINRGHLLIKDYLPTKFEASEAKHSGVTVAQGEAEQNTD